MFRRRVLCRHVLVRDLPLTSRRGSTSMDHVEPIASGLSLVGSNDLQPSNQEIVTNTWLPPYHDHYGPDYPARLAGPPRTRAHRSGFSPLALRGRRSHDRPHPPSPDTAWANDRGVRPAPTRAHGEQVWSPRGTHEEGCRVRGESRLLERAQEVSQGAYLSLLGRTYRLSTPTVSTTGLSPSGHLRRSTRSLLTQGESTAPHREGRRGGAGELGTDAVSWQVVRSVAQFRTCTYHSVTMNTLELIGMGSARGVRVRLRCTRRRHRRRVRLVPRPSRSLT